MKKSILLIILSWVITNNIYGQRFEGFDIINWVKTTPLKDQQSSGTCWSFATSSFLETEALRLGKDSVSLSPMFFVYPTYLAKAEKFIERSGQSYFAAGDLTFSVLSAYEKFGAIPESAYSGMPEGDWQHDQVEMDNLLYVMVESVGASGYGRIKPTSWKNSIDGTLKSYLGSPPAVFMFKNKLYSPTSFAREHIGINPDEYVEMTSYTNGDFYKMIDLEIPANWNDNKYLNLPIEDFSRTVDFALDNGFSLAWDGDATEPNFDFEFGIARLPASEEAIKITQGLRQSTFDDESTTDDHNMHIIGKAKDKEGKLFYILKNSEGSNEMGGYVFMTQNALLLKTISVLVSMDGIPDEIRDKCSFMKDD